MHAVAVDADGHFSVALGKKFAVHAGFVLAELIGTQGRIVLAHEGRIGVAAPAEIWNLLPLDLAAKACGFAHSIRAGYGGIPTVTTGAGQSFL